MVATPKRERGRRRTGVRCVHQSVTWATPLSSQVDPMVAVSFRSSKDNCWKPVQPDETNRELVAYIRKATENQERNHENGPHCDGSL